MTATLIYMHLSYWMQHSDWLNATLYTMWGDFIGEQKTRIRA